MTEAALSQCRHRSDCVRGFTLIELMVTVAILVIVIGVAAPGLSDVMLSSRLTSYANDFVASAQLARGEAIKRNTPVTLCASSDGLACATTGGWEQGWIVLAGTAPLQKHAALAAGYLFKDASSTRTLSFAPSGVGSTSVVLTLCKASSDAKQQRTISVTATGQGSVGRYPYTIAACT